MKVKASNMSLSRETGFGAEMAAELTPISVKEAERVIGSGSRYTTSESIASAILDFTAIARAYLRNVPKCSLQEYN